MTTDERDQQEPEKPFPSWSYLKTLFDLMSQHSVVGIEKSRQVLATTAVLGRAFWSGAFFPHRKILVSKATREEAQELIRTKIRDPFARMPPWIREALKISERPASVIRFEQSGSIIQAVAQNAAVRTMRGVTASEVIIDEAAFQDYLHAMLRAALPMAARVIALTSADGGEAGGQAFIENWSLNDRQKLKPIPLDSGGPEKQPKRDILPEPPSNWTEF